MIMYYFKEYHVYVGEEGWYVYLKPQDPRCKAIREAGPLNKEDAEEMVKSLTISRGLEYSDDH